MRITLIIKLTIFITAIFLTRILFADSGVINKIVVQGNARVESATVKDYLGLKVGDHYNATEEDKAIKRLYATSFFQNINLKFTHEGHLIISVTETPFVGSVVFRGNSKLKTAILSKELYTMQGDSLVQSKIELDVKKILEAYKRSGRFATIVTPKIEYLDNNRVRVIFDIVEGPKTGIKYIYFSGNENYSDGELKSVILTKESRWFRFLESHDVYDYDRIEYDKELLKKFYQSVGFVDVRVISAIAELSPTKEYFTLTYSIDEGPKYKLGKVKIDNKLPKVVNVASAGKIIKIKPGNIFNMKTVDDTATAISEYLVSLGNHAVHVHPELTKNADFTVDVSFVIVRTDAIYVNKINIINNLKTEDEVIRREFKIEEGDVFRNAYIEKGEQNLRNLDYFEKIAINVTPTKRKDRYDVNVNVEEKSTSSIGFDLGYNTAGGIFGRLSFLERNLIGTGKLLNAGLQAGKSSYRYYAGITEPYFLGRNLSLSANVFNSFSGRGTTMLSKGDQGYESRSLGLKTSLGYELKEDLVHEVEYLIKRDILKSPSTSRSLFLATQMGKCVTSAISQTFTYDKTDSKIIPKNGYLLSATQEFAGLGGQNKYIKHEVEGKYFRSFMHNKLTLKLSATAGTASGLGKDKTLRVSDRFNLGDYSLRGFASGGIGPREKNSKEGIGGENYYTFSTELNFPTPLPEEFNVTGAVFMDVGSLWGVKFVKASHNNIPYEFHHDRSIRASVGFGVLWVTRFAPIRMDWAFPIKKAKYDDTQTFHLKFSTHF